MLSLSRSLGKDLTYKELTITFFSLHILVIVQFNPTVYTVTEGGMVRFMLELSEALSIDLDVNVTTLPDTASGREMCTLAIFLFVSSLSFSTSLE